MTFQDLIYLAVLLVLGCWLDWWTDCNSRRR